MVPGSRVNHTDMNPPMIELRVYHFSAAQAVELVSPPPGGASASTAAAGSSGGGGGGCFIGSAKHSGLLGFLSSLSLLSLLGIMCLLARLNPLRYTAHGVLFSKIGRVASKKGRPAFSLGHWRCSCRRRFAYLPGNGGHFQTAVRFR